MFFGLRPGPHWSGYGFGSRPRSRSAFQIHIQIYFSGAIRIRGQIGARIRVSYVRKPIARARFPIRICSQILANLNRNPGVNPLANHCLMRRSRFGSVRKSESIWWGIEAGDSFHNSMVREKPSQMCFDLRTDPYRDGCMRNGFTMGLGVLILFRYAPICEQIRIGNCFQAIDLSPYGTRMRAPICPRMRISPEKWIWM